MSATTFSWVRTASAVVCAKMLRMVAAAISPEPFSITAKTSRTKGSRRETRCRFRLLVSLIWYGVSGGGARPTRRA
ncbi:hypothetical protein ABZ672_50615, partial [Streptomyces mirabilis]